MPKTTIHPRISVVSSKSRGGPWRLMFDHPLNGGQVRRSTRARDFRAATEHAKLFSRLLRDVDRWNNRPYYISENLWVGSESATTRNIP